MMWNQDHVDSIIRSGCKMAGVALVMLGLLDAQQLGTLVTNLVQIDGSLLSAVGIFASMWKHVP